MGKSEGKAVFVGSDSSSAVLGVVIAGFMELVSTAFLDNSWVPCQVDGNAGTLVKQLEEQGGTMMDNMSTLETLADQK